MPGPVRTELSRQHAGKINAAGELVLSSSTTRSQVQNVEDAFARLAAWVYDAQVASAAAAAAEAAAATQPDPGVVNPPASHRVARLHSKKAHAHTKAQRRVSRHDDD
jgi:hypothetical protein